MRNLQVVHDPLPPKDYFIVKERRRDAPRKIYWFWDAKTQQFKSCYIEYMHYETRFAGVKSDNQSKSGWHTANLKLSQLFACKKDAEYALEMARHECLRNYEAEIADLESLLRFPATHDINVTNDGVENLARTAYLAMCKDMLNAGTWVKPAPTDFANGERPGPTSVSQILHDVHDAEQAQKELVPRTDTQIMGIRTIGHVLYAVAVNIGNGIGKDPFELCDKAVENFDNLTEDEKERLRWNSKSTLRHILNITP